MRPVANTTRFRYAEVVAVVLNERQPVSGHTMVPSNFGNFEDAQRAASVQYHCGFKHSVYDVTAAFEELDIRGGEAKIELALCVSNFSVCWSTKKIVCHLLQSEC
ncbi:Beta-glucosidase/6-phospho-beta-glucosidase/ beta-galactosidase [Pseudomonas syringae pv. actinidiae]|uniref:Beta-glucosidase/6-phospho-beta-glucosidase/ beta-galactosidase n=1 Tax=Pseudomonas syringae pv. actinidiae TaxID=103796 RepID=A0A2V0Q445_PSESF|nr:Beta-glucosidase/6-phospho-beta-glucosidase/ beta-galactosidase [Pseudomonas syringae pv. actinidiae]